jgi:hypothetical protein
VSSCCAGGSNEWKNAQWLVTKVLVVIMKRGTLENPPNPAARNGNELQFLFFSVSNNNNAVSHEQNVACYVVTDFALSFALAGSAPVV